VLHGSDRDNVIAGKITNRNVYILHIRGTALRKCRKVLACCEVSFLVVVYVYVCMYICIYVYMYIYIYTYIQ
jgi:hypothetical protein